MSRGLIDATRTHKVGRYIGYSNVAFSLVEWAIMLDQCWEDIRDKTPLTRQEIRDAKILGQRLMMVVAHREDPGAVVAAAALRHRQALTLLVRAYEEARRAVLFLRHHQGDADAIAPSLYGGRVRRRNENAEPAEQPEAPPLESSAITETAL